MAVTPVTAAGNTLEIIAPNVCLSDFNFDGFVTGDDFDAYVAAFESGC